VLRRPVLSDAAEIADAVRISIVELRPWMDWATDEAVTEATQRHRLAERDPLWGNPENENGYVIVDKADGQIVGSCAVEEQTGTGSRSLAYWVRSDRTGQGIATAAARALAATVADWPGVRCVEIHCDQANAASAAVAKHLGFRLDRIAPSPINAPGQSGWQMIWVDR
jgi:RimJ/RimL family protein N-acetyltransferase